MVVLVVASRVCHHAETGMDSVDRGGSREWQLAISDPCHGVAGMGLVGRQRKHPNFERFGRTGQSKLIERSSFFDVLQFLAFGIQSLCH